jgi:hypothetical protein
MYVYQLGLLYLVKLLFFFDFNRQSVHLHVPELFTARIDLYGSMYVCMYVCVEVCMYVYIYVCMVDIYFNYRNICTRINLIYEYLSNIQYMYINIYICMYVYIVAPTSPLSCSG